MISVTIATDNIKKCENSDSVKFAFQKAPIYRVRNNPVEIQHDILHNGPVLSMIDSGEKLESVKVLGWVKNDWLVQRVTGDVVKIKMEVSGDTRLENYVYAIVPAKLDDPKNPDLAFVLP